MIEIEDLKNENVIGAIFAVVVLVFIMSFLTYRLYEPSYELGMIEGEILSYHSGQSKNGAKPYFKARLSSGLIVEVIDERVLPYTYKGAVLLNKMKRKNTVGYVYKINAEATLRQRKKASSH
ncbi:hypothetical protein P886_1270 [Alteromonadaceae bacterium 2753L.S.0a.02]|nr:hypothetical protein P886_1270 [Alteromonadaceae bacterium 2753L.S.0a.02]